MTRVYAALIALSALGLTACGGDAVAAARSLPAAEAPSKPLGAFDVGRKWLFETVRVEGIETRRGTCTIEIVAQAGSTVRAHVVSLGGAGQAAEGGLVTVALPTPIGPIALAALLPTHGGTSSGQLPQAGVRQTSESVTLGAATYTATRYSFPLLSARSCCVDETSLDLWVADGPGLIKAVEVFTAGTMGGPPAAGAVPITTTYELVRAY